MAYLEVEGASLYYVAVGNGPLLLCITGASGTYEGWTNFAESLKDHFTVVSYDRRGFSRSYLNGEQDYAHRLETDADDAAKLIQHLSPHEPATVIGSSSGAIVSLKLLSRHPNLIRTLIPYEPPAAALLPESEFEGHAAAQQDAYETYRAHGPVAGLIKMIQIIDTIAPDMFVQSFNPRNGPYIANNTQYWFEREVVPYPLHRFDVEKEFRPHREKLVLVNGQMSNKTPNQYRANVELGKMLGLEVEHLPGEHVGYASHPVQFAQRLYEVLKAKDAYYA